MKNKDLNFKRIALWLAISHFGMLFMLVGASANFVAMTDNNGKMPFYSQIDYSSTTHFSFQNKDEINHYYLTDIIPFRNALFSIGDLIMFCGLGVYGIVAFLLFSEFMRKSDGSTREFNKYKGVQE